jgi:hypothetical protein
MRWRLTALTALTAALALVALGLGSQGSFSAALLQAAPGESAASLQRVDLRHTHSSLKHCFKRKGARSCQGVAASPESASTDTATSTKTLPLPKGQPPGASLGRTYGNHPIEPKSVESQTSGSSSGFKFTGGMGVPTNRVTLEGALSPYQLPNGNTSASTSGKLGNGLEEQGMHFGLEWHY